MPASMSYLSLRDWQAVHFRVHTDGARTTGGVRLFGYVSVVGAPRSRHELRCFSGREVRLVLLGDFEALGTHEVRERIMCKPVGCVYMKLDTDKNAMNEHFMKLQLGVV